MFKYSDSVMDKKIILKGIAYSLFSPFVIGCFIGMYYVFTLESGNSQLFFSILLSAVANAHIVGLTMGICVLPVYLYLVKRSKTNNTAVLTAALFGGALFSFMFNVASGQVFIVNTTMAILAAGIFIVTQKKQI